MRRWNLPQVNTKVMCAVLTAAMVMTGFTACGGTTSAGTESVASESAEQKETIAPESTTEGTESGEEKVESYLGQITAIDGNVISIALAEKPEAPNGEAPTGEAPSGEKPDGQAPDGNGGAPNGEAPTGEAPSGEKPDGQAPDGNGSAPNGEAPNGQKPEKDMLDEMTLTLSGDTNDDTIITIDGEDATLDELQVGDTVSFFLDGETVTSLSVGMPEPTQPMQAPEQN